jgi:hypothetical protein
LDYITVAFQVWVSQDTIDRLCGELDGLLKLSVVGGELVYEEVDCDLDEPAEKRAKKE